MKFQRIKDMLCGALIASMVLSTGTVAFAKVANINIPVSYNNIKVIVDGKQLTTNKEPFTYEGTTYLPIRAVAEAVGKDVSWDGKTQTVTLSSKDTKTEQKAEQKTEEKKEDAAESENKDNAEAKEPEKTVIFYVTDEVQQSQYINMFKEAGKDAVILKHNIDSAFISSLEQKHQEVQFKRIDADLTEEMKGEGTADEETVKALTELFRKSLNKDKLEVHVENLKNENVSAMMTLSEESRRMQDMMKMYNMYGMDPNMFGGQETLVLNANHPLVKYLAENQESDKAPLICEQLYDLAMMSHKQLSPDEMTRFVQRSNEILLMIAK